MKNEGNPGRQFLGALPMIFAALPFVHSRSNGFKKLLKLPSYALATKLIDCYWVNIHVAKISVAVLLGYLKIQ